MTRNEQIKKLADGIEWGSLQGPQVFGKYYEPSSNGSCAEGAYLVGHGCKLTGDLDIDSRTWRRATKDIVDFLAEQTTCPACQEIYKTDYFASVGSIIFNHLNDWHRWDRVKIADWIRSLATPETTLNVSESIDKTLDDPIDQEAPVDCLVNV